MHSIGEDCTYANLEIVYKVLNGVRSMGNFVYTGLYLRSLVSFFPPLLSGLPFPPLAKLLYTALIHLANCIKVERVFLCVGRSPNG